MLRKIKDRFQKKMFNRLLLLYSAIIILSFSILSFIVSLSVAKMIEEQTISFNKQVLQTVNAYFNSKCRNLKNALGGIYQDANSDSSDRRRVQEMLSLLRSKSLDNLSENVEYQQSVYSYIEENGLRLDNDLVTVCILKKSTGKLYLSSRRVKNPDEEIRSILKTAGENGTGNRQKLFFKPAFTLGYYRMFLLYDTIKDTGGASDDLGYLVFGFAPEVVKNSYSHYRTFLKGDIMILSPDGGVMFDSGENCYGKAYPHFEEIKNMGTGTIIGNDIIINVNRNDEFGFYTVGIIPKAEMYKDINAARMLILWFMLASIAVIILLSYISTSIFSKRVKTLIAAIKKIRHGDLSVRVKVQGEDEVSEISSNLNLMCDMLNEHIQKEYIYQLRQKEAELCTLQAQVSPHFLYNSLEAIRMRAVKMGNSDISRMVMLLANLFRRSIKSKMVVSVKAEMDNCKSFLEFYNIRYDCMLELIYDISEDILHYGILVHLIQPIVENVLVHGINLESRNNTVTIKGYKQENDIYIVVRDNGNGIPADRLEQINRNLQMLTQDSSGSFGIYNVNHRIKLIYGDDYGLSLQSVEGSGTEVVIKIKAWTMEELTLHVQGIADR